MPEFATPEPLPVIVDASIANVTVIASDRTDSVVDIKPTDPSNESDVRAAAGVQVDLTGGRLRVKGPRRGLFSNKSECFDARIEVPTGSPLEVDFGMGSCVAEGRLGDCRVKTFGSISIEEAGAVRLTTGGGRITVDRARGRAEITTATGEVYLGEVDGQAVIKNTNGGTRIGAITGDLRVLATNGEVTVDHAGSDVNAKSTNGSVRLGEVVRGNVTLEVTAGDLEIGIKNGSSAWLDVHTVAGRVLNSMTPSDQPETGDTVEVRARTYTGDIVVHRS
jgi:Putative adhesin